MSRYHRSRGRLMDMSDQEKKPQSSKAMHVGMWVRCAVMLLLLLVFFARGGTFSGVQDSLGVLALIVFYLGGHGVILFFMGKSCHEDRKRSNNAGPVATKIAVSTSMGA